VSASQSGLRTGSDNPGILPTLDSAWTKQNRSNLIRRIEIISDQISSSLPFLGDAKLTVRYASIRDVWEDIGTRIVERGAAQTAVLNGISGSVSHSSRLFPL
jgi:hypothetical protein